MAGGIHLHKCCTLSLHNIEANEPLITPAVLLLEGNAFNKRVCMARHGAYANLLDRQRVCTNTPEECGKEAA